MTILHVRVDKEVKVQATRVFERMGLTMSEGLRVFLRKVAADQALPFPLQVPNAATRAAIEEARAMSARFETGGQLETVSQSTNSDDEATTVATSTASATKKASRKGRGRSRCDHVLSDTETR